MKPPVMLFEPHPTDMDKDLLAAFADGELTPEEAASVAMHLADHPQDQTYVDDLMAANAALARAFGNPLDEPVPQGLRDLILAVPARPGWVVALRRGLRRSALARWGVLAAGVAMAAGVALAVLRPDAAPGLVPGPLAASNPLHAVLSSQPAGEVRRLRAGAEVLVLGSLPVGQGYCREIEVTSAGAGRLQAALACTTGAGWTIEVVIAEALTQDVEADGFSAASGDEAAGFGAFLDRNGAGAALGPDEEAAAIARGWKP